MRYVCFLVLCLISSNAQAERHRHEKPYSGPPKVRFLDEAGWTKFLQAKTFQDVREVFCDGTRPRTKVTRTVHFKPPVESGTPVDMAAEEIKKQQGMAPFFFRNDFFYRSAGGADLSQHFLTHSVGKGANEPTDHANYVSSSDYTDFERKNSTPAADIEVLLKYFTYRIPQPVVKEMYGIPSDDFNVDRFGYSEGHGFAASEAILFKDYIWRYVLIHDTAMKSAPKGDGVDYEIIWTPNLFCKYGVSIDDLKT